MSQRILTHEEKKQLRTNIEMLSSDVHLELFFFLSKKYPTYTPNRNGVFFNIAVIPNNILLELEEKVNFHKENELKLKLTPKDKTDLKLFKESDVVIKNIETKNDG